MEVLIKEELFPENVQDSLTTKFVHDWRAGDYTLPDGSVTGGFVVAAWWPENMPSWSAETLASVLRHQLM